MARRHDDGADRSRLLGAVASVRRAAAVAVLLVGGGRRRSLLAARDGLRCFLQAAVVRGGSESARCHCAIGTVPTETPHHRSRRAIHGEDLQEVV